MASAFRDWAQAPGGRGPWVGTQRLQVRGPRKQGSMKGQKCFRTLTANVINEKPSSANSIEVSVVNRI